MADDPNQDDTTTGEDDADPGGGNADPFDVLDPDEYRDRGGNPFETFDDSSDDRSPESRADERARPPAGDDRRTGSRPGDGTGPEESRGDRTSDESGDSRASRSSTDRGAPGPGSGSRAGSETGSRTGGGTDETEREDPFTYLGDQRRGQQDGEDRDREPDGVRSDVGIPSGDPFADIEGDDESPLRSGSRSSSFEEVDTGDVDADDVWKRLVGEPGPTSTTVAPDEEVEVPKHAYCESCEYFSPPPEVHCTHEGTSILEFVDMETVRVVNCPVVAERRELGHDE